MKHSTDSQTLIANAKPAITREPHQTVITRNAWAADSVRVVVSLAHGVWGASIEAQGDVLGRRQFGTRTGAERWARRYLRGEG